MKGTQDQSPCDISTEKLSDSVLDFVRTLDGKGETDNVPWSVSVVLEEVSNA